MAALLLAITTLTLASLTRGALAIADDSQLITRAQALATTRVETAVAHNCTTTASGTDSKPRLTLQWQELGSNNHSRLHLYATLLRSPIAYHPTSPIQFTIEAGSACP